MGIVRDVQVNDNKVHIKITPTYSGCPAMDTIGVDIQKAVEALGFEVGNISYKDDIGKDEVLEMRFEGKSIKEGE